MPDQHGLGDNGTDSVRLGQSSQGEVEEQHEEVAHPGNAIGTSEPTAFRPIWQFAMHTLHHHARLTRQPISALIEFPR
jgi:hypothetical protein